VPAIPLDTDGASLVGLLSAVAAAYVLGAPVRHDRLFADRFTRPLPLDKEFRFFASPCESVPADSVVQYLPEPAAPEAQAGSEQQASPGDGQQANALDILRRLAAERAELPVETVRPDSHPLDELHLSSITIGQIMNQAAKELGVSAPMVMSNFATSTLADLAQSLEELLSTALPGDVNPDLPPEGVAPWVRAFSVELVDRPQPARTAALTEGEWQVFASPGHPLARALARDLRAAHLGDGVLLCLPDECGAEHVGLMLQAARAALTHDRTCRFVTVHGERGAAGLAKTLHLEAPGVPTSVITLPLPSGLSGERVAGLCAAIVADVAATTGFSEVQYDESGTRRVPVLRAVPDLGGCTGPLPLAADDVLLVSGGGKGITAECALALARQTGASVALLGRSDPAEDAELAANLNRMDTAGVTYAYVRADVGSESDVRAAVEQIGATLGPVTALLHGAGRNQPAPLTVLDEAAFGQTLAPKIGGLEALLAAVDPAALKLVVTFGSIIGRAGLRGQADYATANDWLTYLTKRIQDKYPHCRCLALEWSVWSGAGMGERLGVLESLTREGISPISVDDGIEILRRLLASPQTPASLVVMGRAGGLPTITLEPRELPLTRFIDRPRVHYPGIELVADAELSADSDPYLADHLLDGDLLFPAVLGMEAMAQAAAALTETACAPVFENLEFLRPIVVPVDGSATVRIVALSHGTGVDVAIRSSDTGFQTDHFRATLRYAGHRPFDPERPLPPDAERVPLDPATDLYGGIFFQGRLFQRVLGYRRLAATSCAAEISAAPGGRWFGSYLPGELLLGHPGTRDAFMHAIQCCVPNATLLPAAVERLYPADPAERLEQVVLNAAERHRVGDTYTYDLDVCAPDGRIVERWEGLRLQAVRKTDGRGPWIPALLGPYLERQLAELLPDHPRCVVEPDPVTAAVGGGRQSRRRQTEVAVSRIMGRPAMLAHRGDGKPEVAIEGISVSASHGAGVTLAVTGPERVACDAETVRERTPEDWQGLLDAGQFALAELIRRELGEEPSAQGRPGAVRPGHARPSGPARLGPAPFRSGHDRHVRHAPAG
jgi:enediyne polyketide synthase